MPFSVEELASLLSFSHQMFQVSKCLNEGDDLQPVLLGHALQLDDVLRREAVEGARHFHRPSVGKHVLVLDEERVAAGATDQWELAGAQACYPQSYHLEVNFIVQKGVKSTG